MKSLINDDRPVIMVLIAEAHITCKSPPRFLLYKYVTTTEAGS